MNCSNCADAGCSHCMFDAEAFDYEERDELDELGEGIHFADPGGKSALRAAGPGNPRNLPCPTCKAPNRLTPKDKALGYQCDACADRAEGGGYGPGGY